MRWFAFAVVLLFAGCAEPEPQETNDEPPIVISDEPSPAKQKPTKASPPDEEPEEVRAYPVSNEAYEWEPSGAVNPTDGDHYAIAYRHSSHRTITVRTTFDAGQTWSQSTVPVGEDATGPAAAWDHSGDPVVFFSPEGGLFVGGIAGPTSDPPPGADSIRHGRSILVAASPDGGRSFDSPVEVAAGGGTVTRTGTVEQSDNFVNQDRPWFAAGADGVLIAAWNELGHDGQRTTIDGQSNVPYDGNEFQYAISRDSGATWTAPTTLNHGGWPGALVRSDGTFVLAHSSHLNTRLTIYTSADGENWDSQELGVGRDQPDLQEAGSDLLVATTAVYDGKRAPAYFRIGEKTQGPYIFGVGSDTNPFTNLAVDPSGGFWASWIDGDGVVRLAQFLDETAPWPSERHEIAATTLSHAQMGDYVDTLAVNGRLYIAWNDEGGDDRQLRVSVY